jgi:hypothetical protein
MPLDGRASPYDSATIALGDGAAKICYGRPSLRGREMIGGDAVPYGQLWRTGANEPTILHVNVPARVAGLAVEPGAYSLYTIPEPGLEWTLIVNRSTTPVGPRVPVHGGGGGSGGRTGAGAGGGHGRPVEQLTIRPAEPAGSSARSGRTPASFIPIEPG